MSEFLSENNACGQNLLCIVSNGNALIAEILRLKDYIPDVYRLESKHNQQKYGELIVDFSYLKNAEMQEKKIEESPELQVLDSEIRENYLELLTRFYLAFESTYQYAADLQQYIDELNQGYYVQQTVETVLQDEEGKQLMCEALYLFGVMLLILDFHIPGIIRERLLMSYYRYHGAQTRNSTNIDDVCMLLRSTGYECSSISNCTKSSKNMINNNYPEGYFSRYLFDSDAIDMIIGRLRCDDIYNQLKTYPHPDHRSMALSNQAAMLYVCLYFSPSILHNQVAQMREIVDKYFNKYWVVSIYMGITVNLIDAWDQFKAAKAALMPLLDTINTRGICHQHKDNMVKIFKQCHDILREGVLHEDFILQNISQIIHLMRQSNILLRWYLTHVSKAIFIINNNSTLLQKIQQIGNLICTELQYKNYELFELLLNTAQLELTVKDILRNLLTNKITKWDNYKKEAIERINELSEVFGGLSPMAKIKKNPQLEIWFKEIAQEIERLITDDVHSNSCLLLQLIEALGEVQEFHNLQSNMQVKQYLLETGDYLTKMFQTLNIKEDILINIQLISDLSYAWRLIDRDLTVLMQETVKKHPKSVIRLRAVFLKLASALEIPLMRINQAKSEDLISVSNYYSTELINYMRKVLQIIPETIFTLLARIIQLQTDVVKEIPTRLEKEKLKEYAQFEDRYTIAKLTHSIAVFTEGILMMKTTLVGVIELDAKQLLEDGIRKELVKHLSNALNLGLIFTQPNKHKNVVNELEQKLDALAKIMDGYRRSFEYVQDYLKIHGLKILQEEFTRIINYNVEKECNAFLRNKIVEDWQSQYQNSIIPIPNFTPSRDDSSKSNNFIGRLAYEILQCTHPHNTTYIELKSSWYDKRLPHRQIVDNRFFNKLREAIGPSGLVALNRLYTHMITDELKKSLEKLQCNFTGDKMWSETLDTLATELEQPKEQYSEIYLTNPLKYYSTYYQRWLKVWPILMELMLSVGQKQILRQQLAFELSRSSKCNAKNLQTSLETFNKSLLYELENNEKEEKFKNSNILVDIRDYLIHIGSYEPIEEIFVLTKNSSHMALFIFLFTIAHINRLQYSAHLQMLQTKSSKDPIDVAALLMGLITVLQQYHADVKLLYITYLCQFVKVVVIQNLECKRELCAEVVTTLHFIELFVRQCKLSRTVITDRLPVIILDQYEYLGIGVKS